MGVMLNPYWETCREADEERIKIIKNDERREDMFLMTELKIAPAEFFACRVLFMKEERLDYVVIQGSELGGREDVVVASVGFASEEEAEAAIRQLGGTIPGGSSLFLDSFEEGSTTVWCWKDDRTCGASRTFESEQEALEAWRKDELVFEPPPD